MFICFFVDLFIFFFFKQKTAYDMRISDWSSDVCSSDLLDVGDLLVRDQDVGVLENRLHALGVGHEVGRDVALVEPHTLGQLEVDPEGVRLLDGDDTFLADLVHRLGDGVTDGGVRSEEHTSELQSLMRNSYAVFCLKTKQHKKKQTQ